MTENTPDVLCFGEILWDFLPEGLFPGGAPFNVAYHLHRLGARAHVISAIGRDLLGEELLRRLKHWSLTTAGIGHHTGLPTGYVRAALDPTGDARYEIATSVAWDQIDTNEDVVRVAVGARALVFGSLAQRSSYNRTALDRLLAVLPEGALRVFDVNLRPPHDDLDLVRSLAGRASVLKLNSEEAARLAGIPEEDVERRARALADQTGCPLICITAGSRGAGLLRDGRWIREAGRPVAVADTVGSGDAFLAALVFHLLDGRTPDGDILAKACRLGEWVASCRGGTPEYDSHTPS